MDLDKNVVPGRSKMTNAVRRIANGFRAWFMLNLKYPEVRWRGAFSLVRIPTSTKIWSPHKDVTIRDVCSSVRVAVYNATSSLETPSSWLAKLPLLEKMTILLTYLVQRFGILEEETLRRHTLGMMYGLGMEP